MSGERASGERASGERLTSGAITGSRRGRDTERCTLGQVGARSGDRGPLRTRVWDVGLDRTCRRWLDNCGAPPLAPPIRLPLCDYASAISARKFRVQLVVLVFFRFFLFFFFSRGARVCFAARSHAKTTPLFTCFLIKWFFVVVFF